MPDIDSGGTMLQEHMSSSHEINIKKAKEL
jgi:hypothetical protein